MKKQVIVIAVFAGCCGLLWLLVQIGPQQRPSADLFERLKGK